MAFTVTWENGDMGLGLLSAAVFARGAVCCEFFVHVCACSCRFAGAPKRITSCPDALHTRVKAPRADASGTHCVCRSKTWTRTLRGLARP